MTLLMLMLMLMLMLILENMTYWMTLQVLTQVDGGVCELLDDAADTDAGKCLNPFFPFCSISRDQLTLSKNAIVGKWVDE